MLISVTLKLEDFLAYHLYRASRSVKLKDRRLIHWFSIPLTYIVTGLILMKLNSAEIVRLIFFVTAGVWIILYPFYSKWAIRRFLTRQIKEKFSGLLDKKGSIKLGEKKIVVKNSDNSQDISYTDIAEIVELPDYFFIGLKLGPSLILPKQSISADKLTEAIEKITSLSGIARTDQTQWVWR